MKRSKTWRTSEAVTALDPVREEPAHDGPGTPRRVSRRPRIAASITIVAALLVMAWAGLSIDRNTTPDPIALSEPVTPPENLQDFRSTAVAAFEDFVAAVNRGDTALAQELMAEELPDVTGLGTTSYPHFPTDPELWIERRLHPANVAGFVEYASNLPAAVFLADCRGFSDGPRVMIAGCSYAAEGGLEELLGRQPESGQMFGFMVDGKVAGVVRSGEVDLEIWNRLAAFAAGYEPDMAPRDLGSVSAAWAFAPAYSAESARQHRALAAAMAAAFPPNDARSIPPSG